MGSSRLEEIGDALRQTFGNATITVTQRHGYAYFEVTRNRKNISGRISIQDEILHIEEATTNYSSKYLKALIGKSIRKDIPLVYTLKVFRPGDYIYLREHETGHGTLSGFSYYGYNDTVDCRERISSQHLKVVFLGLESVLCKGSTPARLAKYKVI